MFFYVCLMKTLNNIAYAKGSKISGPEDWNQYCLPTTAFIADSEAVTSEDILNKQFTEDLNQVLDIES
ncbi:unnamed protein product [Musa acuminata subsp. malaccensis]|uniref:(wild Malaysian banana) hypothetical protein n=1 Tax=Musa acuminata subsp. malaccensis TaxID=214687 RepID=A0A804K827_MUSAM|nr:unnamed protein product [Musa acuminata subsp. malaccensis]